MLTPGNDTSGNAGQHRYLQSSRLLPAALILLLGVSAASLLIHERSIAHGFGFPLDSGWLDAVIGRTLFQGEITSGLATESPAHAVVLGAIDALTGQSPVYTVFLAKLLSLFALTLIGWSCYRLVKRLTGKSPVAGIATILIIAVSPALIWSGVSGLGIAWGTALVALGLLDLHEGRPVRGTVYTSAATWFAPTALPILAVTLCSVRGNRATRGAIAAGAFGGWIAWHIATATPMVNTPALAHLGNWWLNWLALIGGTLDRGFHPPLLGIAAALGIWYLRRRSFTLLLAAIIPPIAMCLYAPGPGALGRLLFPTMPAIVALAAVGFHAIAERQSVGVLRGARLALLLLAAYIVWSGPAFWQTRNVNAWQVENTLQVGRNAGEWIRMQDRGASPIATTAPGAVGFFSGHPVIDLSRMPDYDDYLLTERPRWVAINVLTSVPAVLRADYEIVHTVALRVQAGVYPAGPLVVFRRAFTGGIADTMQMDSQRITRPSLRQRMRSSGFHHATLSFTDQ